MLRFNEGEFDYQMLPEEFPDTLVTTTTRNPTWWRRRTSLERYLTLTAAAIFVIAIALIIALGIVLCQNRQSRGEDLPYGFEALHSNHEPSIINAFPTFDDDFINKEICLEPGCIHTASKVLLSMDQSVDPCDDFYQFACGNFVKSTTIPDDKSSVTSFSIISDLLQEQLRSMIEEPIKPDELKPFVLMKKLYKACMNKTAIAEEGLDIVKDIFKNLGGWPVLDGDDWDEQSFDWKELVYKFRKGGYSVDYFIDFSVGIDLKNSTKRVIDLDQAALGLRREFLTKGLDDKLVRAYYNYMVDLAVMFGASRERARTELQDSLNFEISLAKISLPNEKRRNASALYNPMTIAQLQRTYPDIPWLEYITKVIDLPEIKVDENEVVIVSVPTYISNFIDLIGKTPKRVQANYAMWRAAASLITYLTDDVRKRQLDYGTILSGRTERESRWKECVNIATGSLSIAAGALYVRKYFDEDSKKHALEMVNDIREEFLEILRNVDWMDEETRKNAIDKAKSMTTHIAYPDELLDDNKILAFHGDLELDDKQYLKSIINITLFGTAYSFRRLRQPVNKTDWITHGRPAIVNAFYSSIENSIQFPAGILQGIFFSKDRPRYMNYGAIGFVIGHEITHGFDDQGRQFDKNGNLVDWWAPDTKKAFIKKAQCIIDQYGNYTIPELGLHLNGINTQGENIADNGGIKEAYLAYQNWAERHATEPKLPGLKYTPNQMFWISAANTWCARYRPETLKLRVLTGYHSPGYFRVIGPMSNNEYFARDFNCPEGSRMNPVKKCKVW